MKREVLLFVGREPTLLGSLVHLLDERAIDLRVSRDANDALAKFWRDHHPLVVVDLTAPGVDGVTLVRGLKGEPGSPKVLVVGPDEALVDMKRALPKAHRPDLLVPSAVPPEVIADHIARLLRPPTPEGLLEISSVDQSFAGILVELWRRSSTGVLTLEAERVRTTVYFLNGEPVYAEHGALADSLGRTLVRTGLITDAQLVRALERMVDSPAASEQMRLGEALIDLSILSPDQVHEAIRQQVRHKLLSCFQWKLVHHSYVERSDFVDAVGIFKCPVPALLLQGLRRWYEPARLAAILAPRADRYPRLRSDLGSVGDRFGLGATELRFLRTVTGTRTLGRLAELTLVNRATTAQVLGALLLADELELWTEPSTSDLLPAEGSQDLTPRAPSSATSSGDNGFIVAEYLRLKAKSDAEVLRVRPDATEEEVSEGFAAGEARFGPEATRLLPLHLARKASEIFALMCASRDRMLARAERRRLSGEPRPLPATLDEAGRAERDRRTLAELAYQRGKQLLAENAPVLAREELKKAAEAMPEVPELQLLAAYTEYLVANDDGGRRRAKESARAWAEQTLAADPRHAKAHAILGRFLRLDGELEAAAEHLQRARKLDPSDRIPEVELKLLAKQAEEASKRPKRR